jgi:hypothetical protein
LKSKQCSSFISKAELALKTKQMLVDTSSRAHGFGIFVGESIEFTLLHKLSMLSKN